jgi:hypothetical protein
MDMSEPGNQLHASLRATTEIKAVGPTGDSRQRRELSRNGATGVGCGCLQFRNPNTAFGHLLGLPRQVIGPFCDPTYTSENIGHKCVPR